MVESFGQNCGNGERLAVKKDYHLTRNVRILISHREKRNLLIEREMGTL